MNEQSVEQQLQAIERHNQDMSRRISELEMKFEGTRVRFDRVIGTCDDLLKRFEAWKTVGNEMGDDVKRLTGTVELHDQLWAHQQQVNNLCSTSIDEMKNLLQEMLAQVRGKPPTNGEDTGR